jgi:hypothetical protein
MIGCRFCGCAAESTHFHLQILTEGLKLVAVCSEHRKIYVSDKEMMDIGVSVLTREEAEVWLVHQS